MFDKKGFLFIEGSIMVVIAGIGVLSAAVFPSMTGYLQRSRDVARTANLKDITTAFGAYYADKEKYPDANPSGCIPNIGTNYFPRGIPKDPTPGRLSMGCDGSNGETYVYRIESSGSYPTFFIGADLENPNGGNSPVPLDELMKMYPANEIQKHLIKGSGKYYILGN